MEQFEITKDFTAQLQQLIADSNNGGLSKLFEELHPADVAEVLEDLALEHVMYIMRILDTKKASDVLVEVAEDTRKAILKTLSYKEIAQRVDELDSNDAAYIVGELTVEQKKEVINLIKNTEHARAVVDLLRYDENTAGGLMGKEFIKVNEDWTNLRCVKEMRKQAQTLDKVHTVYVVDAFDVLKGHLSLKSLLTTSTRTPIKEVFNPKFTSVRTYDKKEEVALIMQKYDLFVVPVIDETNRLVGQITIDDIMDVVRDEAEKDYQMAAGLTEDVEADDTIFELTKARLPWLVLGLFGGLGAAQIMGSFEEALQHYKILFFFTPLIAAMAGNVGVQSSAIIVQGLANNNIKGSVWKRLLKEVGLSLINGAVLGVLVLSYSIVQQHEILLSLTIAISLVIVILIAALIGTFVPIILDRRGIDPALATGPFITTSNDILGILIYFLIAKMMLGF